MEITINLYPIFMLLIILFVINSIISLISNLIFWEIFKDFLIKRN